MASMAGRIGTTLENCLLLSDDQIFRVPWEKVVHPEFIDNAETPEEKVREKVANEDFSNENNSRVQEPTMAEMIVQHMETSFNVDSVTGETFSSMESNLEVKTRIASSDIEGEYVELSDISMPHLGPQMGSLTQSIALNYKSQHKGIYQKPREKQSHVVIVNRETCKQNSICSDIIPALCPLKPSTKATFSHAHIMQHDILGKSVELNFPEFHCVPNDAMTQSGKSVLTDPSENKNWRHGDISERTFQGKDSDKVLADNCTKNNDQPSLEHGNFSTSLSLQQERRNHFTNATEDFRVVTDALQEPATEHSRIQARPLVESAENKIYLKDFAHCNETKENDQSVPLIENTSDKYNCQPDNIKNKHNIEYVTAEVKVNQEDRNVCNVINYCVPANSFVPMYDSSDQRTSSVAELQQSHDVLTLDCRNSLEEQVQNTCKELLNGDKDKTECPSEPTKEQHVQDRNNNNLHRETCIVINNKQECSHHMISAVSGPEILSLPLETLHEVVEDEQELIDSSSGSTTGELPTCQNISETGKYSNKEERIEQDQLLSCQNGFISTPALPRRNHSQPLPTTAQDVNLEVLSSEVVYLPGTKDRGGRAVVIINTRNTAWLNPYCNASELKRIFLYFYSIPRKDCKVLGLTFLIDARRCSPVPALFKAFITLQATIPNCIHGVLMLMEKDLVLNVEKPQGMQFDILTSTKSLHKHIEASQLPIEFDGSFRYCHRDWLVFRMKLENLQEGCQNACTFLQNAIKSLNIVSLPAKAEDAKLFLKKFRDLMRMVLEDTRLVQLQTEGGAILARLRKETSCVTLTEDYRDAVDLAAELYNQVDEGVHSLVRLSNRSIQEMELVIEFEAFHDQFQEVSSWIEHVGERLLGECCVLEDSLESLLQTQRQFKEFDVVACEYCKRGQDLLQKMEKWQVLTSPETQILRLKLQGCREKVKGFSKRLVETRSLLEKTVWLYQFFDKAYEWALEGMRHLATISLDDCTSPELCLSVIESLERYKVQHPEISKKKFEAMQELAGELKNEKGTKQWKFAWSKCQEARHVFEKKLEAALRTKAILFGEQDSPSTVSQSRDADGVEHKEHLESNSNLCFFQNKPYNSPLLCGRERRLGRVLCNKTEMENIVDQMPCKTSPASVAGSVLSSAFRTRKMSLQSISGEELNVDLLHTSPSGSTTPTIAPRPISRRLLRKAQSFDLPGSEGASYGCQRRLSEPTRRGNTGVFIKGLEVSSTELVDRPCSPRQPQDWSSECLYSERRCSVSSHDGRSRSSKLRHIIDEMVTTEREYVRSLWYISENYFPEMERLDLPQDLRGKRGIIFGNLEKLRDFHSQYFLKELESCCNHPLRVSHCFLRHKDQFGMYALYSKNKPRSDALLASHGNIFFKNKQHQLGDKMDLASYLLKPIQRMSKYALLLKDLIKECGEAQEQELAYLRAAEEMVKFQLRHGNDLLAMDAIRDCDVNLKEQGQLVRQDEFTVWLGRKKCQRHVFLFEDLILFSKPKRIVGGLDVYIYKRSFKTADIGLTENSGDSGLRFEIWFRRRKSNDTHILQASSPETKQAWTNDIAKILWQQASRNKEIRMQEMVSMGVGNKPFLDIKPSDAAINNRAIDYIMKGRGARTRASIAVSMFDHSDPYKRTQAPITCSSVTSTCVPSSSSLLGPLNLHTYVNQTVLSGMLSASRLFDTSSCLEEDELENETSCSQPSMTTESSDSSQCMSGAGSSGSDSGCVANIRQDNLTEDTCSPCDASAPFSVQNTENSGSRFPHMEKRFINRQYISANPSHISLSPSTIV
ncbi:hypothetical protein GDO86_008139 [Hymenochirus boettgeri]|uniref:Puratrophin-1 n=1 Tax=Hymenochirus boettgeri TaxID=247094 RepID=A0A8T2J0R0_9PIPI|nr:hypothetical protein GDO86_008139 [Hymenochirus boettgeri]